MKFISQEKMAKPAPWSPFALQFCANQHKSELKRKGSLLAEL
jgi:hypothetical protein